MFMQGIEVRSPYNQSLVSVIQLEDEKSVFEKLEKAKKIARELPLGLELDFRISVLKKLAELVNADSENLLLTAVSEGGKPFADSKVEVARAIQ